MKYLCFFEVLGQILPTRNILTIVVMILDYIYYDWAVFCDLGKTIPDTFLPIPIPLLEHQFTKSNSPSPVPICHNRRVSYFGCNPHSAITKHSGIRERKYKGSKGKFNLVFPIYILTGMRGGQ